MPTPARLATSSSEPSVPRSANSPTAAASSFSRLRRASARSGLSWVGPVISGGTLRFVLAFRTGGFLRFSVGQPGRTHRHLRHDPPQHPLDPRPFPSRRLGPQRGRCPARRARRDRRAHLLEQEVTLAYLRELAGPAAARGRARRSL